MKFLAQLLLVLTLCFGLGLDMTDAAEDVSDLHAVSLLDVIGDHDASEAAEGDPELGTFPNLNPAPRTLRRLAHTAGDPLPPPPFLPPQHRPPRSA